MLRESRRLNRGLCVLRRRVRDLTRSGFVRLFLTRKLGLGELTN